MAAKKTFVPTGPDGKAVGNPIAYTPIYVIAGSSAYELALHRALGQIKTSLRKWVLSDPVSGVRICDVHAYYKGLPVSNTSMTTREAAAAAPHSIDTVLANHGALKFERAIAEAWAKYGINNQGAHHETRQ